jgi:phosphoenolpyruvate-protein phosphotransferase
MKGYIAASPGIGIGKVFKADGPVIDIDRSTIAVDEIEVEIQRLENAVKKSKAQLLEIYEYTLNNLGKKQAGIINAYIMIVEDPVITEEIRNRIRKERIKAEYALVKVLEEQIQLFEGIEDSYLKERAADINEVCGRILKNILGLPDKDVSRLDEDAILVGTDIKASLLAVADRRHVKGIVSEKGSITSHVAILARSMDIPAVFGAKDILPLLEEGQLIALDGSEGMIETDLDSEKEARFREKIRHEERIKNELLKLKDVQTRTKDGKFIRLEANIGRPEDVKKALDNGAEGIGLFRTEFLFMDRNNMPCEEEQFQAYRQVAEAMEGKPVTIRTLDIGGDKEAACFHLPKEANPFLGWRAIRICLENTDIFKTQLRAVLRASAFGKVRIMYPMIASVEEVMEANKILDEARQELKVKGLDFDENIEVGVMIEIPSAAISADLIIKEVDFFSIGTNDLTQYTLAVDRTNEKTRLIYNSFHPAVLRLIKNVILVSHKEGKPTGMCGEMAGDPAATAILLEMGLDEFSMDSSCILKIRKIIKYWI